MSVQNFGFGINPVASSPCPQGWSLWLYWKTGAFLLSSWCLCLCGSLEAPASQDQFLGDSTCPHNVEQRALTNVWVARTGRVCSFHHSSRMAPLGTGSAVLTSMYSWHIPGSHVTWLKREMPLCQLPTKDLDAIPYQRSAVGTSWSAYFRFTSVWCFFNMTLLHQ